MDFIVGLKSQQKVKLLNCENDCKILLINKYYQNLQEIYH